MNNLLLEASRDGHPFFSKSIDHLKTAEGEPLFPEVFEIPTCEALREYEALNNFVIGITGFMLDTIEPFDLLVISASNEDKVLLWSIEITLNENEISLRTIDWINDSCIFRHEAE